MGDGFFHELSEMDTKDIFLKHVAPGLGCVVAFMMFVSPFQAVLQVRKQRSLGDLNALPLVAIIANCTGWLLYGCINEDIYVILANEPGLLLGVFMSVTCYGYADPKIRDNMLKVLMFFTVLISITGIVIAMAIDDDHDKSSTAGLLAVFILLCYYSAPLTSLYEVLRNRSSATLYWPSSVMNTVNGSLWVAYGWAVHDSFILYPNLVGAVFGVIQLALIAAFPSKASRRSGVVAGHAEVDGVRPLLAHPVDDVEDR